MKHPDKPNQLEKNIRDFNSKLKKEGRYGVFVAGLEDAFNLEPHQIFADDAEWTTWIGEKADEVEAYGKTFLRYAATLQRVLATVQTWTIWTGQGSLEFSPPVERHPVRRPRGGADGRLRSRRADRLRLDPSYRRWTSIKANVMEFVSAREREILRQAVQELAYRSGKKKDVRRTVRGHTGSRPRQNWEFRSRTTSEVGQAMTEYDLSDCGIDGLGTIEVEGALTKARIVAGAPIVFLFDEHHTTPQCIVESIQNAQTLIDHAGVMRLYVESHAAGQAADQLTLVSARRNSPITSSLSETSRSRASRTVNCSTSSTSTWASLYSGLGSRSALIPTTACGHIASSPAFSAIGEGQRWLGTSSLMQDGTTLMMSTT